MGTVVSSLGTISRWTRNSMNNKMFHDGTDFWIFYMKSGTADTLFYAYSSDLSAFTESSVGLRSTTTQDGATIDVAYDSASASFVVSYYNSTIGLEVAYMRGTISGTSVSWTTAVVVAVDITTGIPEAHADGYLFASNIGSDSKVSFAWGLGSGNAKLDHSTNVISSSFADTAGLFTSLSLTGFSQYANRIKIFKLATSGDLIILASQRNSGSTTMYLQSNKYSSSAWGGWVDVVTSGAAVDSLQWGSCQISTTSTWMLGISAASTFSMNVYGGASWTNKTAPSWPTNGLASNSGIALLTDGTDIWAFVIRGDGSATLAYNKYTVGSDSWGGWNDIEATTSGTDVSASINVGSSKHAVLYTKTNGGNYDLVVTALEGAGITVPNYINAILECTESGGMVGRVYY